MKRFLLAAVLALSMLFFTACGGSDSDEDALMTGFSVASTAGESADAGAENGLAQIDTVAVGVLVDGDGVIEKCVIDSVRTSINFSADGTLLTPTDTLVPTKRELGDDYGMHKASSIGKDWKDQIDALCDYVEGKTLEEVKDISVDEKTAPADEDLAASVTISIGGYIDGIEKAVGAAEDRGAKKGDQLGLGIVTAIDASKSATADEEGLAQANSSFVLTSIDQDGKVTGCLVDGLQYNVAFDAQGKITSDINAEQKTKDQLGEDYGMKDQSGIGKEWYEQAAAYGDYIVGKTLDEVLGMSLNEKGAPADEDLAASVTISVGGFNNCLEKAVAGAR